jgi:hypothetical protein
LVEQLLGVEYSIELGVEVLEEGLHSARAGEACVDPTIEGDHKHRRWRRTLRCEAVEPRWLVHGCSNPMSLACITAGYRPEP